MPKARKSKRVKKVAKAVAKVISGHGAYHVGGGKAPKRRNRKGHKLGGSIRGHGSYESVGRDVGGWLGKGLGELISGAGAYSVRQNTLMTDNGPPVFATGDRGFEFIHREFLFDVSTSVPFAEVSSVTINPGNPLMFPLLSRIALNFEEYDMLGLILEFKTNSATALGSTNTALGTMVIATDYDVLDKDFTTKQQAEAYMFSTSTVPSCSMIHPIECASRQNVLSRLYVKDPSIPLDPAADPRFYHMGKTQIFSGGAQAASVAGEIWVSYHVRLYKPKLPSVGDVGLSCVKFQNTAAIATNLTLGTVAAATIQTSGDFSGSISAVWASGTASNVTFKQTVSGTGNMIGRFFLVEVVWASVVGGGSNTINAGATGTFSVTGGAGVLQSYYTVGTTPSTAQAVNQNNAAFVLVSSCVVTTTSNVAYALILPQVTIGGTVPVVQVFITEVPANFTVRPPTLSERFDELEARFKTLLLQAPAPAIEEISDAESIFALRDEADLEKSVHISRDQVKRLLSLTK